MSLDPKPEVFTWIADGQPLDIPEPHASAIRAYMDSMEARAARADEWQQMVISVQQTNDAMSNRLLKQEAEIAALKADLENTTQLFWNAQNQAVKQAKEIAALKAELAKLGEWRGYMQEFVASEYLPQSGWNANEFKATQECTEHWLKNLPTPPQAKEADHDLR